MVRQKLPAILLTYMNHAAKASIAMPSTIRPYKLLYLLYTATIYALTSFTTNIRKGIEANFSNQVVQMDESMQEGSRMYQYNFTGSPQSLYWLPKTKQPAQFASKQNQGK